MTRWYQRDIGSGRALGANQADQAEQTKQASPADGGERLSALEPRPVVSPGVGASRRQRIAKGSGTDVIAVGGLLKQFRQMKKMLRKVSRGNMGALTDMLPPGMDPTGGGAGPARKRGRSKTRSRKNKRRKRK